MFYISSIDFRTLLVRKVILGVTKERYKQFINEKYQLVVIFDAIVAFTHMIHRTWIMLILSFVAAII